MLLLSCAQQVRQDTEQPHYCGQEREGNKHNSGSPFTGVARLSVVMML